MFREGHDVDVIQFILLEKMDYPLTIVYIPLRLCGFAYKLFEHILGTEQYFPPGTPRMIKHYHYNCMIFSLMIDNSGQTSLLKS